ncbi:MAG: enoyl-[acyl-carrier-protein] reductase [Planctomycetes bacterium]|nr:enoyl-[acyl-carrier-protein] reductase [Planctomycetota bacterium]
MLGIDLRGKVAFVAGIADDQGFGFSIARKLIEAGAEVYVGTWPPVYNLFTKSLERGKFDSSMTLEDGSKMSFKKIYPLDAVYDSPDNVPAEVKEDKRYKAFAQYTISEVAAQLEKDLGGRKLDIMIHSLANGPEVKKPLLETSRSGYLAAISASAYSMVSMCQHFCPLMSAEGAAVSLTYLASERTIPGYGGGMSTAKAALESDTRYLAYECGRAYGVRVNTISAGPLGSRAAKAIGFIGRILDYSTRNQPLAKILKTEEVGNAVAFLCSQLSSAITGTVLYVDNGFHAMGVPVSERGVNGGDLTSIHVQEGFEAHDFDSPYKD